MSSAVLLLVCVRSVAMGVVAVVPVACHWRRSPRALFASGAAAWFVTVALKIAWALPMNHRVRDALAAHLPSLVAKAFFDGYVGMLTGLFEVGLVFALANRVRRLRHASADDALAFGLGFGGIEALVLALTGLAALADPATFDAASVVLGPLERVSATIVHVVCCTLVLSPAFRKRPWRSFGLAFAFKSIVDAVATFATVDIDLTQSQAGYVTFELGIAAIAMVGLVLTNRATMPRASAA